MAIVSIMVVSIMVISMVSIMVFTMIIPITISVPALVPVTARQGRSRRKKYC
jgi:hypothetical protein